MRYSLYGIDGNAFSIIAYVSEALRNEGLESEIPEYRQNATSGDYDNLLFVSVGYIDRLNKNSGGAKHYV